MARSQLLAGRSLEDLDLGAVPALDLVPKLVRLREEIVGVDCEDTRPRLELDCWITGVRRDQAPTRANAPKLGWDEAHELWKANPLANWGDDDCWAYIRRRGLPYNALHDQGYASIGDTHSTIPGAGREGRWAGTSRTECGLHVDEA